MILVWVFFFEIFPYKPRALFWDHLISGTPLTSPPMTRIFHWCRPHCLWRAAATKRVILATYSGVDLISKLSRKTKGVNGFEISISSGKPKQISFDGKTQEISEYLCMHVCMYVCMYVCLSVQMLPNAHDSQNRVFTIHVLIWWYFYDIGPCDFEKEFLYMC